MLVAENHSSFWNPITLFRIIQIPHTLAHVETEQSISNQVRDRILHSKRGKRKADLLKHKPNSLAGRMDLYNKHNSKKMLWNILTEDIGIKYACQLYCIYRHVLLCLIRPCFSHVSLSLFASNTALQSSIPEHKVRQGICHTEITSPHQRLFPFSLG